MPIWDRTFANISIRKRFGISLTNRLISGDQQWTAEAGLFSVHGQWSKSGVGCGWLQSFHYFWILWAYSQENASGSPAQAPALERRWPRLVARREQNLFSPPVGCQNWNGSPAGWLLSTARQASPFRPWMYLIRRQYRELCPL